MRRSIASDSSADTFSHDWNRLGYCRGLFMEVGKEDLFLFHPGLSFFFGTVVTVHCTQCECCGVFVDCFFFMLLRDESQKSLFWTRQQLIGFFNLPQLWHLFTKIIDTCKIVQSGADESEKICEAFSMSVISYTRDLPVTKNSYEATEDRERHSFTSIGAIISF